MQESARFAMCVGNAGVAASLDLRRVYRLVADAEAASLGLVGVVDDSGEDYLYPDTFLCRLRCRTQQFERLRSVRHNHALEQARDSMLRRGQLVGCELLNAVVRRYQ